MANRLPTPFIEFFETFNGYDTPLDVIKVCNACSLLVSIMQYMRNELRSDKGFIDKWVQEAYYNSDEEDNSDDANDLIKKIISSTPVPMADCPDVLPSEEEEAAANKFIKLFEEISLDPRFKYGPGIYASMTAVIRAMGESYYYSYLLVPYFEKVMANNDLDALDSCMVSGLVKVNFYNLKFLRFGLGDTPPSEEDRKKYLDSIDRNTIRVTNYARPEEEVVKILNQVAPFWNKIKDANITGSFIYFLLHTGGYSSSLRFDKRFSSKYFDLRGAFDDNKHDSYFAMRSYIKVLALYFPKADGSVYTCILEDNEGEVLEVDKPKALLRISYKDYRQNHLVDLVDGTDLDVPVFDKEQVDRVAHEIYDIMEAPGVEMTKNTRTKGSSYSITMSSTIPEDVNPLEYIKKYLNFYPVDIYSTTKHHIGTHHVDPARGYLECKDGRPLFNLDPSMLYFLVNYHAITNYYYFAGKKSTPLDVICRYNARGASYPQYLEDRDVIFNAIKNYKGILPYGMSIEEVNDIEG